MAQKDWNAGIIRPVPVAPAGPYQDGAAPGVWTLDQVAYWLKQGLRSEEHTSELQSH